MAVIDVVLSLTQLLQVIALVDDSRFNCQQPNPHQRALHRARVVVNKVL
jgi:hypothetical protein